MLSIKQITNFCGRWDSGFKFAAEWIHAIRNNAEIRWVQSITSIIEVSDEQSGSVCLFFVWFVCSVMFHLIL